MTELKREFSLSGAYSLGQKYGQHGMDMKWLVIGEKGAIQISMSTAWCLGENQQSNFTLYTKGYPFDPLKQLMQPHLVSVDYHSKEPQYEGQEPMKDCAVTGGDCYFDGTMLWFGEEWMEGFLCGGSEWLWEKMEEEYRNRFEDGPEPDLTPKPLTLEAVEEANAKRRAKQMEQSE